MCSILCKMQNRKNVFSQKYAAVTQSKLFFLKKAQFTFKIKCFQFTTA